MVNKDKAEQAVAAVRKEIADVDDEIIGEVTGVAQALGELRKALDAVDACLKCRDFEKAASLGYEPVSENFVFLQRTLGGLQGLCSKKQGIVQEIARELRCPYEEALPYVDAVMRSPHPLTPSERATAAEMLEAIDNAWDSPEGEDIDGDQVLARLRSIKSG